MELTRKDQKLDAEHGVVSSFPDQFFGYYGWPTITRMDDGTLVAAASGLRTAHVCPFGRNVVLVSRDDGRSWTSPRVVNDSPLDDRDTGAVPVGENGLLLTWFTTDNRPQLKRAPAADRARWEEATARINDTNVAANVGAWACQSRDAGETWEAPVRVPLTAPHGPIRRQSGDLLYLGKQFITNMQGFTTGRGKIAAMNSDDGGLTWNELGEIPLIPGTREGNYHEPHVAELPDGTLVGMIRIEEAEEAPPLADSGVVNFSMVQTVSTDGGRTWSAGEPLNFHGCPPHLLVHSSGALVCVYGRRQRPYGERVMFSTDGGGSWEYDYSLRDDGPDSDLGYPSTVELADGRLLTMYYQKPDSPADKCSLLCSRWRLPD